MAVAVVTGGSRGLGRAVGEELARRGWSVVIDGREPEALEAAAGAMRAAGGESGGDVAAVAGDVTDASHRSAIVDAVGSRPLDLLLNNASELGPSPMPELRRYPIDRLRRVLEVNVVAPVAMVQALLPALERAGNPVVVNVSSDAAVEHYETWGGYGASKAALDHLTGTWAAEVGGVRFLSVDPGDMRTDMHQAAFPGEDISDRPLPSALAPDLLELILGKTPSGRHRATQPGSGSPSTTASGEES